jgi:hypothetical protein
VDTRIALATRKKNQLSVSDYYMKMSHYADELAASGTPLRNDESITYLLARLDEEYNPVFIVVIARVYPISPSELYAQILSFDHRAPPSRRPPPLVDLRQPWPHLMHLVACRGRGHDHYRFSCGGSSNRSRHGGSNNNWSCPQ